MNKQHYWDMYLLICFKRTVAIAAEPTLLLASQVYCPKSSSRCICIGAIFRLPPTILISVPSGVFQMIVGAGTLFALHTKLTVCAIQDSCGDTGETFSMYAGSRNNHNQ